MADLVWHREAGVETRRPCGQRQAGLPSEQGSELARVTDFHAAVLRPPSVEGMLADRDDLPFRESALPHQVLPTTTGGLAPFTWRHLQGAGHAPAVRGADARV